MGDSLVMQEASVESWQEVNAFTDPDAECLCVKRHTPKVITFHIHHILPLAEGGPDTEANTILLCPTTHYNIHHLLREYKKHNGIITWLTARQFSPFAREIAYRGWLKIKYGDMEDYEMGNHNAN